MMRMYKKMYAFSSSYILGVTSWSGSNRLICKIVGMVGA